MGQIENVLEEYKDHLPLTVRQIFYRLVGEYGYEKDERAYGRLAETLVRARRSKRIPFSAIRDDGIVQYSSQWHNGPEGFWDETAERIRAYRRDRQVGQHQYVELWCEAAGMAPQLARVADEYSVPVFSAGGFASLTAVRLIANRALRRDVQTVLLHVGDYDPSGESIFNSIAEDAAAFVKADRVIGTQNIYPIRVALTADQVDDFDLETSPAKKDDKRSKNWEGAGTCQLEALAPDQLAWIVERSIRGFFDTELLLQQIDAEGDDRAQLLRALPEGSD